MLCATLCYDLTMDVTTAQQHLDQWLAADLAVSTGQSYTKGDRSLTRANAEEITNQINYWQGVVNQLSRAAGGIRNPTILYAKWS